MQSRFNLPGWFGLGALAAAVDDAPAGDVQRIGALFNTILNNAEMSLLKADMGIAPCMSISS